MQWDDLEQVREELRAARTFRDSHLREWASMVEEITGDAYRGESIESGAEPGENFALAYVSLVLPRVAHDVPRVRVTSEELGLGELLAEELTTAMNAWAPRIDFRREAQRIAVDYLIAWGVSVTVNEPTADRRVDLGGKGFMPRVYRVSPLDFFVDPGCEDVLEAAYQGHTYIRSLEHLRKLARENKGGGWLPEAVEALEAHDDPRKDKHGRVTGPNGIGQMRREVPDRDEVHVTEVWVPDLELPGARKGQHHGAILTLAESGGGLAEFIREPRPYYGPPSGPYTIFGAYTVPGDPYPLGPLMSASGMIRELNEHMQYIGESAKKYRRLVLVDRKRVKLAQDIASSPDLFVVPVEQLDNDAFAQVEFGGITPQQIQWSSMSRERLERLTGINEVIRGTVTGNATATEVQTASASSGLRIEFIKRQYIDGLDQVYRKAAWYLCMDKAVKVPLGSSGMDMTRPATSFSGGRIDPTTIDLEIDAFSIERTNDALMQRRAIEMTQMVLQLAQAKLQMPGGADYEELADRVGEMLNMPELGRVLASGPNVMGSSPMMPQSAAAGMPVPGTRPQAGPASVAGLARSAAAGPGPTR